MERSTCTCLSLFLSIEDKLLVQKTTIIIAEQWRICLALIVRYKIKIEILYMALLTYERIDFLVLLLPQRRTASIVSLGSVLKHILEDGGAF
jgi:hypothetical protein